MRATKAVNPKPNRVPEEMDQRSIMLRILQLGRKEVRLGRTKPLKQAFAEVRELMKDK